MVTPTQDARLTGLANAVLGEENIAPTVTVDNQGNKVSEDASIDPEHIATALSSSPSPEAGSVDSAGVDLAEVLEGVNPEDAKDYESIAANYGNIEGALLANFMVQAQGKGFTGEFPRVPIAGPYVVNLTGEGNVPVTVRIGQVSLGTEANTISAPLMPKLGQLSDMLAEPELGGVVSVVVSNNHPYVTFRSGSGKVTINDDQMSSNSFQAGNKVNVALSDIEGFDGHVGIGSDGMLYITVPDGKGIQSVALGSVDGAMDRSPAEFKAAVEPFFAAEDNGVNLSTDEE
jgi:hypothetical protein